MLGYFFWYIVLLGGLIFFYVYFVCKKIYFVFFFVIDFVYKLKKMLVDVNIFVLVSVKECGERFIYGIVDCRIKMGNL